MADRRTSLSFDPDFADAVEPAPTLFYQIRVPCACGRSLLEPEYQFFPSAVFARGVCPHCGPRSAIFAPHMEAKHERLADRIARNAARLVKELTEAYGESERDVMQEFITHLEEAKVQSAKKIARIHREDSEGDVEAIA